MHIRKILSLINKQGPEKLNLFAKWNQWNVYAIEREYLWKMILYWHLKTTQKHKVDKLKFADVKTEGS